MALCPLSWLAHVHKLDMFEFAVQVLHGNLRNLADGKPLAEPGSHTVLQVSFYSFYPDPVEPLLHVWTESQIGWFEITDHLPRYPTNQRPRPIF